MPRFFGYRRRFFGRRRYGSRYGRRYFRRNWYRRGYGARNARSNSSVTVVVPFTVRTQGTIDVGSEVSGVFSVCPFASAGTTINAQPLNSFLVCSLGDCDIYDRYAQMYEEFKINGMTVDVNVTNVIGEGGINCLGMATNFDRKFTKYDFENRYPSGNQNRVNPAGVCRLFVNNERATAHRSCWASDLNERTQFVDTDHGTGNLTINGVTGSGQKIIAWQNAEANVNFFSPCFQMSFFLPSAATAQTTIITMCEVRVYCTFRNPKYGGAATRGDVRGEVLDEAVRKGVVDDDGVGQLESAFEKLKVSGIGGADKDWQEFVANRLARKKARLAKIKKLRALEKELEKDDETLIDPEEEVLPDDVDLLMDDDDVPTQPIKELENKSSS